MGVSIVVGGQYGSEGKGKVALFFAKKLGASIAVRVGGSNSGHTVNYKGRTLAFRVLPVASVLQNVVSVLPAGSYIDVDALQYEIQKTGIDKSLLKIHPNAAVITQDMKDFDVSSNLITSIGSTGSGTGAAVLERVSRRSHVLRLAKDEPTLSEYICDTGEYMRKELDQGKEIIIEGTQGYGLSVLHSPEYPFVTSRDTTASAFLSEAGLSPFDVSNIIMVIRTFPIRVGGNSGSLPNETTWDEVTNYSGFHEPLCELTTVTKRVRRVAFFNSSVVKQAISANSPNIIVLNHCDYFDHVIHGLKVLTTKAEGRILSVEESIERKIDYLGTADDILFER